MGNLKAYDLAIIHITFAFLFLEDFYRAGFLKGFLALVPFLSGEYSGIYIFLCFFHWTNGSIDDVRYRLFRKSIFKSFLKIPKNKIKTYLKSVRNASCLLQKSLGENDLLINSYLNSHLNSHLNPAIIVNIIVFILTKKHYNKPF